MSDSTISSLRSTSTTSLSWTAFPSPVPHSWPGGFLSSASLWTQTNVPALTSLCYLSIPFETTFKLAGRSRSSSTSCSRLSVYGLPRSLHNLVLESAATMLMSDGTARRWWDLRSSPRSGIPLHCNFNHLSSQGQNFRQMSPKPSHPPLHHGIFSQVFSSMATLFENFPKSLRTRRTLLVVFRTSEEFGL